MEGGCKKRNYNFIASYFVERKEICGCCQVVMKRPIYEMRMLRLSFGWPL